MATFAPHPLDGEHANRFHTLSAVEEAALGMLVETFAELEEMLPQSPSMAYLDVPADLAAVLYREPRPLLNAMRELARLLVRRAVGGAGAPGDDDLEAAQLVVAQQRAALSGDHEEAATVDRESILPAVGELIREVGLEEFDRSVHLALGHAGTTHLAWYPVPPESAQISLLGRLFYRLESICLGEELLGLERIASRWAFDRWSPPLRVGDPDAAAFTSMVREEEWSLAERRTLTFGLPVVHAFCEQPAFNEVPPRQQQLGRALRGAFTGVFRVAGRDGDVVVFEAPLDGKRYRVFEHNTDADYGPGFIGIGRLIPLGGGRWLRSPGMIISKPRDEGDIHHLASALEKPHGLDRALVVEAALAIFTKSGRVPREIPPAPSVAVARELLPAIHDALEEHGLAELAPADEVPANLRAAMGPGRAAYGLQVDSTMADWIKALTEQANRARAGGGRRRAKAKRRKGRG